MKFRFSTGEMAKHFNISKQTLIYYDRIGVFCPNATNEDTGYRYYTIEQCEELDVILSLKNIGMSLKEIRAYLALDSTADRVALLESQEERVREQIRKVTRAHSRIASMVDAYRKRLSIVPFEMGVKHLSARTVFSEPVKAPHDQYQLEIAIKRLLEKTRDRSDAGIHEFFGVIDEDAAGTGRFLKVGQYVESNGNDSVSAGEYAYIIHKGAYGDAGQSRKKLTAYVEERGLLPAGPFVESMLLDYLAVSSEDEYLVEIQVPVRREHG